MSTKRCPQCGKSYPSSYRSCPYCSGKRRGRRSAPDTPVERFALFLRKNGDRIFFGVTAFFLAIALLGMLLTRCSKDPEPKPEPDKKEPQDEVEESTSTSDPLVISNQTLALFVGESAALAAGGGADPEAATTWSSSDETVVSVDADGVVTANAAGSAAVTATRGEESAFCIVTVREKDPDVEVYLNRTDFTLSAASPTFQMEVKVRNTKKKYEGSVVWSIADASVATVSETGEVERVGKGTTKVTATMGTKVLECIVRCS